VRNDFKCGCCQQIVPEQYYGGSCSACGRIRCDQCMRRCDVCGLELCPDCLARTDNPGKRCGHAAPPPWRELPAR
jgi:hypothetical protein